MDKTSDDISVLGMFTENGDHIRVSIKSLDLSFPELGMFNVENYCLHITRSANRQWKRGISQKVVKIGSVSAAELRYLGKASTPLSNRKVLQPIFTPEYPSPEKVLNDIVKFKRLSRAFNSRWYIANALYRPNPVVGFKGSEVGWVDGNIVLLPESTHHLFEELSEYLQCRRI